MSYRPVAGAVGGLFLIAGQAVLFDRQLVLARLIDHWLPLPRAATSPLFPTGIPCALLLLVLGGMGVAASLRPAARPTGGRGAVPSQPVVLDRAAVSAGSAAVVLAGLVLVLCLVAPSNALVPSWLVTMLLPLPWLRRCDRRRQLVPVWTGRDAAAVAAVSLAVLVLLLSDLTDWHWAGTPDEIVFYDVARSIASGSSTRFWLAEAGAFDVHGVLASVYQAAFLRLFGEGVFAWRLSSVFALLVTLPCWFLFARELLGRRVALASVVLLGSTPLVVTFAHFGYDNIQMLPVLGASLAAAAVARRGSAVAAYLAGVMAGLGFYTYYPARLAVPLMLLLGWQLQILSVDRERRPASGLVLLGLFTAVAPWLSYAPDSLLHMAHFVSLGAATGLGAVLLHALAQWGIAASYPVWFFAPHHFQIQPVTDPISGALAAIGVALCLRRAPLDVGARFLVMAWLFSLLVVGLTSEHPRPPLTRLLFLAPFVATFAAVGFAALTRTMRRWPGSRWLLLSAAVVWSIVVLRTSVRETSHGPGDGRTAEFIRLALSLPSSHSILLVGEDDTGALRLTDVWMQAYGLEQRYRRIEPASVEEWRERVLPPLTVVLEIRDEPSKKEIEGSWSERFPAAVWKDSDAGRSWSLRYSSTEGSAG